MDSYAGSLTQYYSSRSTDELVFILSTKQLTPEAKQSLEQELKKRGVSELDRLTSEVRDEQEQVGMYMRTLTPEQFLWSLVMWTGLGLCLFSVVQSLYGPSLAYETLLAGLSGFAAGLWMLRRFQAPRQSAN